MSNLNYQGKYSKHNKKGRTFYIVLSACFVVLTAAAVLTYNGIKDLMSKDETTGVVDSVQVPKNTEETEKEDSLKFFEQDLKEGNDDYITTEEKNETIETKASKAGVIVNPTEQKEIIKKATVTRYIQKHLTIGEFTMLLT